MMLIRMLNFIDHLTDFLGSSEGQSIEEVKAELREQGVEIDSLIEDVKELVLNHGTSTDK